jgi:bifunctional UDP-N-acetylglucosamine pyrophosphorylase/glucosamine-1-phosphate N-acetyltransferase
MTSLPLSIVILAAGKGTRMKSNKAKVLHEVFYAPMVHHVLNAVLPLQPMQTIVIVGHQQEAVSEALVNFDVSFVTQEEQLGTGHAVLVAENTISENAETVMILCGDTPLVQTATLQEMYSAHLRRQASLTLMTTILDNPTNYGRILCDSDNKVQGIVEQKDATTEQLEIKEINAGIYCVDKKWLFHALQGVGTDNSQGEVYLTDIVQLAVDGGLQVEKFTVASSLDVLGVNSRIELADAENELQMRRNRTLMLQGVTMHNPATISVSPDSSVDKDTILGPGVNISNGCRIGRSCTIGQGTILSNCSIGDNAIIGPYSLLVDRTVASNVILTPYSQ